MAVGISDIIIIWTRIELHLNSRLLTIPTCLINSQNRMLFSRPIQAVAARGNHNKKYEVLSRKHTR